MIFNIFSVVSLILSLVGNILINRKMKLGFIFGYYQIYLGL